MVVAASTREGMARVRVNIYGEEYVVRGSATKEHIQALAAQVNKKMELIAQHNGQQLSPRKMAVLVALNLADELSQLQEDYDNLVQMLDGDHLSREEQEG